MNIAMITGRITDLPELRTTPNGKHVTSFCIADNRDAEHVSFIDCVAWERAAEFICKYFKKGSWISCTGAIQSRTYKDAAGSNRKVTEVVVDRASFCGDRAKEEPRTQAKTTGGADTVANDDDLPF